MLMHDLAQWSPVGKVVLDIGRSSVDPDVFTRDPQRSMFDLPYGRRVELRVFVDHSVVLAKRIFPSRKDSVGVQVYSVGGRASVATLDAWEMQPVWPVG